MKQITEYLTTKVSKSKIKATNETIKQIIKEQLDKYGHNCDLNHVDVSEVTDMDSVFSCDQSDLGKRYLDLNPDISEWNVSNVKKMRCMFFECENFNSNISKWNVSSVTNMKYVFYKCRKFNCDLNEWNVSNVLDMNTMFEQCISFNGDISEWDVSNVENMANMLRECERFNKDLSKWDVRKVSYHANIFKDCPIEEKYKPKFK